MKKIYKIFIFVFTMSIFSNLAYGYINIYPIKFKKDITNGEKESFRLYNRTEKSVKYRIYIEKGEKNDMKDWIEIYPKSIILNPLEEKEIRLSVTPSISAPDGEYKAKLIIKEIHLPGVKSSKKVDFLTLLKLNMTGYIKKEKNEKIN